MTIEDGRCRTAAIIGAGPGGLAAAVALAKRNWEVKIFERREELLPVEGFALACFENLLRVLEALDAYEEAIVGATCVRMRQTIRSNGAVVHTLRFSDRHGNRMFDIARSRILQALNNAAERLGVEVCLGTTISQITPRGEVVDSRGNMTQYDLVVIANGVFSELPQQIGLQVTKTPLKDGVIRAVLSNSAEGKSAFEEGVHREIWSRNRRLMLVPYDNGKLFVALSMLVTDTKGRQMPANKQLWTRSFPLQGHIIEALPENQRWDQFFATTATAWSSGRVAAIGDAVHAQPPNLGQGAACAMMNAVSLAYHVSSDEPISKTLRQWEAAERPLIEHTQRVSRLYGRLLSCPDSIRATILRAINRSEWLNAQRQRTARYVPVGLEFKN